MRRRERREREREREEHARIYRRPTDASIRLRVDDAIRKTKRRERERGRGREGERRKERDCGVETRYQKRSKLIVRYLRLAQPFQISPWWKLSLPAAS